MRILCRMTAIHVSKPCVPTGCCGSVSSDRVQPLKGTKGRMKMRVSHINTWEIHSVESDT